MDEYGIKQANVIRHFDVNGKYCPGVPGWGAVGSADKWNKFKASLSSTTIYNDKPQTYRVRKSWADADTQKGAFESLDNAKKCVQNYPGYHIYDSNGALIM